MLEPKRKTADLSGKRVLVVEDDPSIAIGLRINLESEGYVVHVAEDGELALDLARSLEPDLIVGTSVGMIRDSYRSAGVPILNHPIGVFLAGSSKNLEWKSNCQ